MTALTISWICLDNPQTLTRIQEKYFHKINKLNILHSPAYAVAQAKITGQRPRIGLIEINGNPAGYVQIMEIGIFKNMIHALILDRGPLWMEGYGSEEHFEAFMQVFSKQFPKRFGRKIRIIPEIKNTEKIREIMHLNKYKKGNSAPYETAWIDLEKNEDTLRQNLKKNWRSTLKKAEDNALEIHWDKKAEDFKWLMQCYAQDKAAKGYDGPSVKLINELAKTFTPDGNMLIGTAIYKGQKIGAILLFLHKPGATYQIGWTSDLGRQKGAHHLLLWQSLTILKQRGIKALDLGGMNNDTALGVKKFKAGLDGEPTILPGLYTA